MKRRKFKENPLRILAGILIMLGIVVCIAGIGIHIVYLHDRYQGFAENGYFDSFLHYYYAVGKGNLAVYVFLGIIPAGVGMFLLRKKS